jgi:hypothetical protein
VEPARQLAAQLAGCRVFDSRLSAVERREWMKMACSSQLALGLQVSFTQYDLIVLQKTSSVAGPFVGWNVPNRRSQIVVLMPKFTTCRW